jgi:hypothetical protein
VSDEPTTDLPEGITLQRTGAGGYELRIAAPDAEELVWRLHDLVEMVQSGHFDQVLDQLES